MHQIEKLLKFFQKFEFTDLIAFGNILGVEEVDPFEDYVTNICDAFQKQSRIKRKQLLKLARDVAGANSVIKEEKDTPKD